MLIHTIRLVITGNGNGAIYVHKLNPARSLNFGVDIYGTPVSGFIGTVARIYETDRDQPIAAVASLEANPLFLHIDRLDSGLLHITTYNTYVFMVGQTGHWPDFQRMELQMIQEVTALHEQKARRILSERAKSS